MTKKGDARKALRVAHFSSVIGGTFSDIVLIVCAPFLALLVESYLDLPEKAALLILSLSFIGAAAGGNPAKGLISTGLGLLAAFIGTGEDFYPRLTMDNPALQEGLPLASVILGILIVGAVLHELTLYWRERGTTSRTDTRIKEAFFARAKGIISADCLHWIEHLGHADQTVADYSLMYDFTIVGRRDVLVGNERYEFHPERIITQSGRPVLLVPRAYNEAHIHEHAVLAWDGNRTATAALWAAMSILETKQKVTILTVETRKTGKPLPGIDAETVLNRHGIKATRGSIPRHKEGVARSILDYCDQSQAGLLVMGAFQTSLFGEELFGGVTKQIMSDAKIPVLLSHESLSR